MAQHPVCPWWLGYWLASPLRRLWYDPAKIVAPYVRPGATVVEPGPGMGFFTLELARFVGPSGRVVAIDLQPRMLAGLERRLAKAGLAGRVECRRAQPDSLGVADLTGRADFFLAFAMVHEVPSPAAFFREAAGVLKPGAVLLLAEPKGHVKEADFADELKAAADAGFRIAGRPSIRRSCTALLERA